MKLILTPFALILLAFQAFSQQQPKTGNCSHSGFNILPGVFRQFSTCKEALLQSPYKATGTKRESNFSYGDAHRLDSIIFSDINQTTGLPEPYYKQEYYYDLHQLNTSMVYLNRDVIAGTWAPKSRYDFTYHQNNRMLLSSMQYSSYNTLTNHWQSLFRFEYQYDINNLLESQVYYGWDHSTGQFRPEYKSDHFWSGMPPNHTESLSYLWNDSTSSWNLSGGQEYLYNHVSGKQTAIYSRSWNDSLQTWEPVWKRIKSHYPDHKLMSMRHSIYSTFFSQYIPDYQQEYFYDTLGRPVREGYDIYDHFYQQFFHESKWEYEYGPDSLVSVTTSSVYDRISSTWTPNAKNQFHRDSTTQVSQLLLPYFFEEREDEEYIVYVFGKKLLTSVHSLDYDNMSASWNYTGRSDYFYSQQQVSVEEPGKYRFRVYPNPVSEHLRIETAGYPGVMTAEFYDLSGRMVLSHSFTGDSHIDLSSLSRGIYICRVVAGQGSIFHTGKIVKK